VHNLVVDAYSMQHPEDCCRSAKSYAAHLCGLCCAIELGGDPKLYWAIPRWLDGKVELEKPPLLVVRGRLTIADIGASADADHPAQVRAWAANVWEAYAVQHEIARAWMRVALGARRSALGTRHSVLGGVSRNRAFKTLPRRHHPRLLPTILR